MAAMLSLEERAQVRQAIQDYGFKSAGAIAAIRRDGDAELPFDLLARAAVEHPDARVRWSAIDVLDHYDEHRHDEAFVATLADPVPRVRRHAAHALGCDACSLAPSTFDAVPALLRAVQCDENAKVRRQALWGLLPRLDDERVQAALATVAADDVDQRMRREARAMQRRALPTTTHTTTERA
jgi:HEAT repeat protein